MSQVRAGRVRLTVKYPSQRRTLDARGYEPEMRAKPRSLFTAAGGMAVMLSSATLSSAATPTAQYTVTFDATWSQATHPTGFPPGPHWSPLITFARTDLQSVPAASPWAVALLAASLLVAAVVVRRRARLA